MCGIIGYCGNENATEKLIDGLKKLEYRGYDSSGISVFSQDGTLTVKSKGRIENIEKILNSSFKDTKSNCGIGHTRWATHGKPSDRNAHPHSTENVCIVHNGIIENYLPIKRELEELGYTFLSETDSEVIAVLAEHEYLKSQNAENTVREVQKKIKGSYACAIIFKNRKDTVYAIRNESPLIAAATSSGNFISSDIYAVKAYTDKYIIPNDGDMLVMTDKSIDIYDKDEQLTAPHFFSVLKDNRSDGKNDFPHYMIKEIFDSPAAIKNTCSMYTMNGLPYFNEEIADLLSNKAERLFIIACGTALNAGKIGKTFFEKYTNLSVFCETASEFRYYPPKLKSGDIAFFITQSGETADTIACLKYVKEKGIKTTAIVNTQNSSIARYADSVLYTQAGTEIAVASTKAYTAQCSLLYLLAISTGLNQKNLTPDEAYAKVCELHENLPPAVSNILADFDRIKKLSEKYSNEDNAFFIGRGADYYLCEESALKLKEISYIHAEAYPAGELKHGTIALIEKNTPVFAVASDGKTYIKTVSNIDEVKARGARVLLVTDKNDADAADIDDIYIIKCKNSDLFPVCSAIFFQLFAYYSAVINGKDPDKPRNLAKSVTVE